MKLRHKPLTCRAVAMNLLAQREHSYHELIQKLTQRDFERAEIIATLDELAQQRLLSDERFSEMYVRHRSERGYGPARISQELQQRGVNEDLINNAIFQLSKQEWRDLAFRVHRKRFGLLPTKEYKEQAAQMRFYFIVVLVQILHVMYALHAKYYKNEWLAQISRKSKIYPSNISPQ